MKVATAFYDKNGLLAYPQVAWKGSHPTAGKLTVEAGYWHSYHRNFTDPNYRDLVAVSHCEEIMSRGGTPVFIDAGTEPIGWCDSVCGTYREPLYNLYIRYIVEEPHRGRYLDYVATADRLGIDPEFESPYDGVAEFGPDYRTQH